VRVKSAQHIEDVAIREISEQSVFGMDAIEVMFSDFRHQSTLIRIDETSEATVQFSDATDFADRELLDDVGE
jgi:hypothetical protein